MKLRVIQDGKVYEFDNPDLVLVSNNSGMPVAVAAQTGLPDMVIVGSVDTPNFNQVLHTLGIDKTVIVQQQSLRPLQQLPQL